MKNFLKSFVYAFKGFRVALTERNFKIHLIAAILVLIASYIYKVSVSEFIILIIMITIVLAAEMLNTAIEIICNLMRDKLNLGYNETEIPRDIGAAIVLICAICSVIVGIIIFWDKIF